MVKKNKEKDGAHGQNMCNPAVFKIVYQHQVQNIAIADKVLAY
jgi:hypothetical protein